jgi:hypothetical protein
MACETLAKLRQRVPAAGLAGVTCCASPPGPPVESSPVLNRGVLAPLGRVSAPGHAEVPPCGGVYLRPRSEQRGPELGQDGQVNVQIDSGQPPHPQRSISPLVLQPAKLALHRSALRSPEPDEQGGSDLVDGGGQVELSS